MKAFLALGRCFRLWGGQNGPGTLSGDLFGDFVKRFRNNLKGADPGAAAGIKEFLLLYRSSGTLWRAARGPGPVLRLGAWKTAKDGRHQRAARVFSAAFPGKSDRPRRSTRRIPGKRSKRPPALWSGERFLPFRHKILTKNRQTGVKTVCFCRIRSLF